MKKTKQVDWERGIGEAETHGAGPVRSVPVTAAVIAADARRKTGGNATASEWRRSLGLAARPPEARPSTFHLIKQPGK